MNTSFFQIIANSGGIGIFIWLWLFIFSLIGLMLGINSVVFSIGVKRNKYPLALKLLLCNIAATLFTGAMGTVTGYVDTFACLASTTGAEKAAILHLSMSQSRVSFYFALGAAFMQLFFLLVSVFLFNSKLNKLSIFHLSLIESIKKIPFLIYLVTLTFITLAIGVACSLWGIEKIVILKPGDNLPEILGMKFTLLMNFIFISGCIGVILLLILLLQTIVKCNRKQTMS